MFDKKNKLQIRKLCEISKISLTHIAVIPSVYEPIAKKLWTAFEKIGLMTPLSCLEKNAEIPDTIVSVNKMNDMRPEWRKHYEICF